MAKQRYIYPYINMGYVEYRTVEITYLLYGVIKHYFILITILLHNLLGIK